MPGFNFNVDLAGRNHKRIMPVGGLGCILSQHEYNVVTYQSQHSIYVNSNSMTVVKDHVLSHYLSLHAGLAVRATAHLWIEGVVMLTDNFQSKTQSSGFNTTTTTAPVTGTFTGTNTPVFETTTTITNYPVANTTSRDLALALSAGIKLHYDFKLCGLPMGCYIGGTGCFTR